MWVILHLHKSSGVGRTPNDTTQTKAELLSPQGKLTLIRLRPTAQFDLVRMFVVMSKEGGKPQAKMMTLFCRA
jgi:hypothetical protein